MNMSRRCPECDSEMVYHGGDGNWECPNPDCHVFYIKLSQSPQRGNLRSIDRIVYATVL